MSASSSTNYNSPLTHLQGSTMPYLQAQYIAQRSHEDQQQGPQIWLQKPPAPQSQYYNDKMSNNYQIRPENSFANTNGNLGNFDLNQQPWPQKVVPPNANTGSHALPSHTNNGFQTLLPNANNGFQNEPQPGLSIQVVPQMPYDFDYQPPAGQDQNVFVNEAPFPNWPNNRNQQPSGHLSAKDLDWDNISHETQTKLCDWFGNVLSSLGFDVCKRKGPK